MDGVDNNQFEVKPVNSKRKITAPCPNAYMNPALDLLANEDPMCNTAMEIVPNKKRKRTKSCDIATFENSALDLGISKAAVNEFLARELDNVKRNMNHNSEATEVDNVPTSKTINIQQSTSLPDVSKPNDWTFSVTPDHALNDLSDPSTQNLTSPHLEPIYANITNIPELNNQSEIATLDTLHSTDLSRIPVDDEIDSGISVLEQRSLNPVVNEVSNVSNTTNIQTNVTNQVIFNNTNNLSLSFIDRLALDSPIVSDQSLYLDDDLNESNIMEIKTITIVTKRKRIGDKKNTNPFLDPNLKSEVNVSTNNPFIDMKPEIEYQEKMVNRVEELHQSNPNTLIPRRLFVDTNSTISTVNDSSIEIQHEYENIDNLRPESPIYENIEEANYNKQSKILGCDVSHFGAMDIMSVNKIYQGNPSNESSDSKKDHKNSFLKVGNKLSKKVLKTLKKTFKHDKVDTNVTLNPYEVPRKLPKQKTNKKESGIENPGLNLDNSDDLEIEELDDEEHQYETIKTKRNTQYNMNVTPLRVRDNDLDYLPNRTYTPGKKVRFDSTIQEKVITGNSFDYDMQSPGFDAKIDKYHDELENCINERKFIQQNM